MKNKIRTSFQLLFLALIGYVAIRPLFDNSYLTDFESYCPFGGLASLGSKLNQGTMSCNMSEVQVMLGIGLLVGVIIIGKLFCSYVCPIGAVTEWLGKIGERFKFRFEMPKYLDRPLRSLKYILLFITLYLTMTTSELFCKKFDPYFASVNLLDNTDITLYFAIPALVLTILGAIFFRLFWCKYLCPLSAVSNIFYNVIGAGIIIVLFIVLNLLGAELSYVYLIGGLVLIGLISEVGFMRSFWMPLPKITRDATSCSDCGLCDSKCPQGIKISEYNKVNHIDCNLCTDCVYHCPLKNTLSLNKSKNLKYLSPVAVVLLIAISLGFSSNFEFTTISERWGDFETASALAVYEYEGLKNVKCYGSAMSLKGNLEHIEGIYGLDAYARSHTVKLFYDPNIISEQKVKSSLFTPIKLETQSIAKSGLDSLAVFEVGVFGLFDLIDFNNLFYTLRVDKGIYGFETSFGEPVLATIYYDPSITKPENIIERIKIDTVTAVKPTGGELIDLTFDTENDGIEKGYLSLEEYRQKIFRTYDRMFNNYNSYDETKLSVYVFPFPESGISKFRRYLGSLSSHISADDGIVRLSTRYSDGPKGYVFFDPNQTSSDKIKSALEKSVLTVFLSDTETRDIENPFHIKGEGYVLNAEELNLDEIAEQK
jgi:hypothetical protein